MTYSEIKRGKYYVPGTEIDHVSVNHYEDFIEYHIPLECMHNLYLHDWGIVSGLEVSGSGSNIDIDPGIAIDGNGQLISLSNQRTISTSANKNKTVYVTIRFNETVISGGGPGGEGKIKQDPNVEFLDINTNNDDGTYIILAIAKIDLSGNFELKAIENGIQYGRRLISETSGEIRIHRSDNVGGKVQEKLSGKIGTIDGGGLRITVPETDDDILLSREDGSNFSKMEVRADTVVFKDSQGRETMKLDADHAGLYIGSDQGYYGEIKVKNGIGHDAMSFRDDNATLTIGSTDNEGDIKVIDTKGNEVLHFNGAQSIFTVGNIGNEGNIVVNDNAGIESARINGDTGTLSIKKIDSIGDTLNIRANNVVVKDSANRDVFDFRAEKFASLYLGAKGNEGDFGIRDGAGQVVLHFNGKNASLKIGGPNNEGDIIILDDTKPTALASGRIDGKTGTLSIKRIDSIEDALVIDASLTRIGNGNLNVNGDVTALTFNGKVLTGSKWTDVTGGGGIYYNLGSVGIGKTNPGKTLDVNGDTRSNRFFIGNKWMLSGIGDRDGNDEWLRLFNADESTYYGGLAVGKLWIGGKLNKLDVADNFEAVVGCADFKMGHSSRRGEPGRALVDYGINENGKSVLVLNYGPDWDNTRIRGNVHADFIYAKNVWIKGIQVMSSREVKENIFDLSDQTAFEILNELNPVEFNFKENEEKERHAGFIAETVPILVGSPDNKSVNPMGIISVLTKVVKEQQRAILALQESNNRSSKEVQE